MTTLRSMFRSAGGALLLGLLLAGSDVFAATSASTSPASAAASDSSDVVAAVAKFHAALAAGDSTAALGLLTADALIVEGGAVETRADYRGHHLPADIQFARAVPSTRRVVRVTVQGDAAWVVSTSVSQGESNGRTVNSAGAELVVLRRGASGWQISAVHWSSRTRRPPG
ncbi:MAG TPA: nuclear transport factor 2 family protein [Gemmatimonadaceae bacterium]